MCKCLFSAGPKLSLAYLMFSIAAKYTALDYDLRHRCNRMIFYLISTATTEFSSTSSLGSKRIA